MHVHWLTAGRGGAKTNDSKKVLFFTYYCSMDPVAKFIVPDKGDKVNYGIGLSYRLARLHIWRVGTTPQATAPCRSQLSGTMNLATVRVD